MMRSGWLLYAGLTVIAVLLGFILDKLNIIIKQLDRLGADPDDLGADPEPQG